MFPSIPCLIDDILSFHPSLNGISSLPPLPQPHDILVQPQHLSPRPRHFLAFHRGVLLYLGLLGIFLHNPICIHHCSFHYLLYTFRILKRYFVVQIKEEICVCVC